MKVVLVSESQSRKRSLDILGLTYEIHPSTIDEKSIRDSDPAALTKKLAEAKARNVASAFDDAVVRCAGAFEGDSVLRFADSVSGNYNFITAMPVSRLAVFLREQGVEL